MKKCLVLWLLVFMPACIVFGQADIHYNTIASVKLWDPLEKVNTTLPSDGHIKLIVTISPECPMCRNYTLTLKKLKNQYAGKVEMTGIIPGAAYTDEEIKDFAEKYDVQLKLLADKQFIVTGLLKASVTPEAYLFDENGMLVYQGAIDDWLTKLGKKKTHPSNHYVHDAVEALLAHKPVAVPFTEATGCAINDY